MLLQRPVPGETLKRIQSPESVQGHCTGSKPENQIPSVTAVNF